MKMLTIGFLLSVCLVYGSEALHCEYGEGIVCRNYSTAKSCGMLSRCEDLWRHADILNKGSSTGECKICKHLWNYKMNKQLARLLSMSNENETIKPDQISELHTNLKNSSLVCALLVKCEDTVFTLPTLNFNASSTCTDCERIMDDIRVLIEEQATKTAISTYLKSALCIHLPLQLVNVCKQSVDSYTGVIIDLIASKLESEATCALFGLCPRNLKEIAPQKPTKKCPTSKAYSWIRRPAESNHTMWHSRLIKKTKSPACTDCQNVFSRIRNQVENPEFDKILKTVVVNQICSSFGIFIGVCESAVSKQVDEMIDNASKTNLTDLCVFFNQCGGTFSPSTQAFIDSLERIKFSKLIPNIQIPVVCEFCEALIKKILDETINNRTEKAVMEGLKAICDWFPEAQMTDCKKYIEDYGTWIVDAIISGAAPKVICMSIGLCWPWKNYAPQPPVIMPLVDNSLETPCFMCEAVTDLIFNKMQQNSTVPDIEKSVEAFCVTAHHHHSKCKQLVKKYTPTIIELFISGVPKSEICKIIKLCKSENAEVKPLKESCVICELIIEHIYSNLKQNSTLEQIEKKLETVCDYIPYFRDECHTYTKQYTTQLIVLLMSNMPPRQVCQELGICAPDKKAELAPLPIPKDQGCRVCEMIIDYIYTKIERTDTMDQIEKKLESICNYIPYYQDTCHEYVKAYTADLVKLLVDNISSKTICQELGLCPPDDHVNDQECSICIKIVDYIYTQIEDEATIEEIEQTLETVCNYIPYYKSQCHTYVRTYTEKLLRLLVDNVSSEKVCQELGFCESVNHIAVLCRGGPSAWCRDPRSAVLCSKTSFCEEFFWQSPIGLKRPAGSVEIYNCRKLTNLVERCKQERLAKMCGLSTTECAPLKALSDSRKDPTCAFCHKVLGKRLLSGSYSLDCSIYITQNDKENCKQLKKLPLPNGLSWEKMDDICKENNMCDNQLEKKKQTADWILGGNPCQWGTSVICQSMDNADRCGKVEFCRRQVWKGQSPPTKLQALDMPTIASQETAGIKLVDCELPLDKLCISPSLRYCGPGVQRRCNDYLLLTKKEYVPSKADLKLKETVCRGPRFTLCNNTKTIEICGLDRYCEAMGLLPSVSKKSVADSQCARGPAYFCQTKVNAKRCNSVELCRAKYWL